MQSMRRSLLVGALVLSACSGQSDGDTAAPELTGRGTTASEASAPGASEPGDSTVIATSPAITIPVPIETSDPTVISRRTEGLDVLVLPDGVELPPDYIQAAVPVDAFAAVRLTISEVVANDPQVPQFGGMGVEPSTALDPNVDVSVDIRACRLVAVWVLPHPDEIVVGYEEYPELTCTVPLIHRVEFEVPRTGKNSEGEWDYSIVPWVVPLRKIGQFD